MNRLLQVTYPDQQAGVSSTAANEQCMHGCLAQETGQGDGWLVEHDRSNNYTFLIRSCRNNQIKCSMNSMSAMNDCTNMAR